MQQSGPGDIPQSLHCNWSSGTGRAAKAPRWPRVISVYRAVSHPSEWTAIAGSCTGTRGEHTLSICATRWRRAPFLRNEGRTRRIKRRSSSSAHWGRRMEERGKNPLHFLRLGGWCHEFLRPIKSPGSEVALDWQCCSNLNYPLPGCAGPWGHVAPFPLLLS